MRVLLEQQGLQGQQGQQGQPGRNRRGGTRGEDGGEEKRGGQRRGGESRRGEGRVEETHYIQVTKDTNSLSYTVHAQHIRTYDLNALSTKGLGDLLLDEATSLWMKTTQRTRSQTTTETSLSVPTSMQHTYGRRKTLGPNYWMQILSHWKLSVVMRDTFSWLYGMLP